MNTYENEVYMINIPKDDFNTHKHYGVHPYVVLKNYGRVCLVAPCTSAVQKRKLPTHVFLKTKWKKDTVVLVEQMITVKTSLIEAGSYKATLCKEDVKHLSDAICVQLGVRREDFHNQIRGNVFSCSCETDGNGEFVVLSNNVCNHFSPVVHIAPLTNVYQRDFKRVWQIDGEEKFINLKDIRLVQKEYLNQTNTLTKDSITKITKSFEDYFVRQKVVCP